MRQTLASTGQSSLVLCRQREQNWSEFLRTPELILVADTRPIASIEAVERRPRCERLYGEPEDRHRGLSVAADREADPGRRPRRRRQDRARKGNCRLARHEDDPPAML